MDSSCRALAMMRRMVLCGGLTLAASGCALAAGLDDFRRRPESGTGGGGAGSGGAGGGDCTGAHEIRHEESGHCYYFEAPFQVGWTDARDMCIALGEGWQLATVGSQEELFFLILELQPFTTEDVWIGGNDRDQEGVFVWQNGEPWEFTAWDGSEPDNAACAASGGEDCVELELGPMEDGDFSDECCDASEHFVCERP